jgi:hypothetical protein
VNGFNLARRNQRLGAGRHPQLDFLFPAALKGRQKLMLRAGIGEFAVVHPQDFLFLGQGRILGPHRSGENKQNRNKNA